MWIPHASYRSLCLVQVVPSTSIAQGCINWLPTLLSLPCPHLKPELTQLFETLSNSKKRQPITPINLVSHPYPRPLAMHYRHYHHPCLHESEKNEETHKNSITTRNLATTTLTSVQSPRSLSLLAKAYSPVSLFAYTSTGKSDWNKSLPQETCHNLAPGSPP